MNINNQLCFGSIIMLRKEFEEQYIAIYNHTFPQVLERIMLSNIPDYSIFLHDGILFSHLIYSGNDFEADMKAMGADKSTPEWWKLNDPMLQPFDFRKSNEWWAELKLWHQTDIIAPEIGTILRHAYTVPLPDDLPDNDQEQIFGDISFWGTTYELKCLKIFRSPEKLFIYIESTKASDLPSFLEIISRVLKTGSFPQIMTELFHTDNKNIS